MTPEDIIRNPKRVYQPPPFADDPTPEPFPRPRLSQWWIVLAWMAVALAAGTCLGIALP